MQLWREITQRVFLNLMRRYLRGVIKHASFWKVAAQHSAHRPISLGQVLVSIGFSLANTSDLRFYRRLCPAYIHEAVYRLSSRQGAPETSRHVLQ